MVMQLLNTITYFIRHASSKLAKLFIDTKFRVNGASPSSFTQSCRTLTNRKSIFLGETWRLKFNQQGSAAKINHATYQSM